MAAQIATKFRPNSALFSVAVMRVHLIQHISSLENGTKNSVRGSKPIIAAEICLTIGGVAWLHTSPIIRLRLPHFLLAVD